MSKICPVCGETYYTWYPICYKCNQLKEEGKVIKCESCGTWHYFNTPCPKCNSKNINDTESQEIEKDQPETTTEIETETIKNTSKKCLICGEDSGEYLFCSTHYYKYRNKTLLLKINNCTEIELLDESYEGIYVCKDGHVVKSKSERDIDNYLFLNEYFHAYERAISIDGETFKPDFCLINVYPEEKGYQKNVYIEHWGYDETNIDYTQQKKYKLEKYEKAGITLICLYEKSDAKDIDAALDRKLSYYKKGKINYLE